MWGQAMTDREDRRVDAGQAPYRDPVPNRLFVQPDRMQLAPADHPVLPRSQVGELDVRMFPSQRFALYYPTDF